MHDKGIQLMVKIDTGLFLDVQGLSVFILLFMMFGVIYNSSLKHMLWDIQSLLKHNPSSLLVIDCFLC